MRSALLRLSRAALVLGAAGLFAVGGQASLFANPVVSSISPIMQNPGQVITVNGQNFTDGNGGGCTSPPPTVIFEPLDGSSYHNVQASGNNCSDRSIQVTVPNISGGGARIVVQDATISQHQSDSTSAPFLTSPAPAVSGLSPSNGTVDTHKVTINGVALTPPTLVGGSNSLIFGGSAHAASSWSSTAVSFDPGSISGAASLAMTLRVDPNNNRAISIPAGSYTFQPPAVGDVNPSATTVGSAVTISGSNMGSTAGSVVFGGGSTGQVNSWAPDAINVVVPAGAQNGALTIRVPGFGPVNGPSISLNPLAQNLSKGSASAGDSVSVAGFNFGTDTGTITVGGTNESVTGWSDRSVSFNVTSDTDGGTVVVTRPDGQSSGGPSLAITPHLTKLDNNNIAPGASETVEGVSFGSQPGTISIAGQTIKPQLWSRTTVLFTVPASIKAGNYQVLLKSAGGVASNTLGLVLISGPPPPSPGATPSPGAKVTPVYDNNHDFVKPIKPPSPVDLTLTADPHKIAAGGTANLTVTLKLNGKPVAGAEIKLSMVSSPGTDYVFTPPTGTTDQNGVFKATVKISKAAGDNVILAQSGTFSDQDAVTGTGSSGGGPLGFNPASGATVPLVTMGIAALVLVAGGLFVNLRSHGYI